MPITLTRSDAELKDIQAFNASYNLPEDRISNSQLARKALKLGELDSATGWASREEVRFIKAKTKHIIEKLDLTTVAWNEEDPIKIGTAVSQVNYASQRFLSTIRISLL